MPMSGRVVFSSYANSHFVVNYYDVKCDVMKLRMIVLSFLLPYCLIYAKISFFPQPINALRRIMGNHSLVKYPGEVIGIK